MEKYKFRLEKVSDILRHFVLLCVFELDIIWFEFGSRLKEDKFGPADGCTPRA
jgi:hypothetical protein